MTIRTEILQYAKDYDIPDWMMCNNMCVTMEEYNMFSRGDCQLSLFHVIVFIISTEFVPASDA